MASTLAAQTLRLPLDAESTVICRSPPYIHSSRILRFWEILWLLSLT
jgi:hypothetical protein